MIGFDYFQTIAMRSYAYVCLIKLRWLIIAVQLLAGTLVAFQLIFLYTIVGGDYDEDYRAFVRVYREQYRRDVPPGMENWHSFAVAQRCSLHAGYMQINEDLSRLRSAAAVHNEWKAGDIPMELVHAAAKLELTTRISVAEGKVHPPAGYHMILMQKFAHLLPDTEFVINNLDEPRIFADYNMNSSSQNDSSVKASYANIQEALQIACRDPSYLDRNMEWHGFLIKPASGPASLQGKYPIFSGTKLNDCFYDIMYPNRYFWDAARTLDRESSFKYDPFSIRFAKQYPFSERPDGVFWRGSTTGGGLRTDRWLQNQRIRLVEKFGRTEEIGDHVKVDVGFHKILQCEPHCDRIQKQFEIKPSVPTADACKANKFMIDVDGNTFSQRFATLMECGALVLKSTLFTTWMDDIVHPWTHYIPISLDYQDIQDRIHWAQRYRNEANRIASAGASAATQRLRTEDMECYMYRLLLEYTRLLGRR